MQLITKLFLDNKIGAKYQVNILDYIAHNDKGYFSKRNYIINDHKEFKMDFYMN